MNDVYYKLHDIYEIISVTINTYNRLVFLFSLLRMWPQTEYAGRKRIKDVKLKNVMAPNG